MESLDTQARVNAGHRSGGPFVALLIAASLFVLGGCDNPACIFSSEGCNGSGGGGSIGENPASVPEDGEWISVTEPTVLDFFPREGSLVDTRTPIVFVFSESMSPLNAGSEPPDDLSSAFELSTTTGFPLPFSRAALVGDGRMLVLATPVPLAPSTTYSIVLKPGALVVDRTGQELRAPLTGVFGSFATPAVEPVAPSLVATWPQDEMTQQSGTSEIVTVFDRPMLESSVTTSSFAVTVGGNPPPFNPVPDAVDLGAGADTRVFSWRSVDDRTPVELGHGLDVTVTLSPLGNEIEDTEGEPLDAQSFEFTTAAFSAPLSAEITSTPNDAIGIDDITGPADLAIEVALSGAQAGDFLVLTLFGGSPAVELDPPLNAIRREVALVAPFDSFTMTADEIDLVASTNPVEARLADGPVAFAFQVRRGSTLSPVRVLDVDPLEEGVQSPLLDTVAPHLVGLGTSGTALFVHRSDVRDVVLLGRASERLTKVLVATALGDNEITPGVTPPVVGSEDGGAFIAAPIRLGVLPPADLPLDFTMTLYDRAQNVAMVQTSPTDAADGFRQLGASGPGTALPGGNVTVEVFDAASLAPIAGAEVWVHQERLGSVAAVNTVAVPTSSAGLATTAAAASGTTIVTVRNPQHDLFTFQGVPTSRLGVPLSPAGLQAGSVTGTVGPVDTGEAGDMNTYARSVTDTRRLETGNVLFPVSNCSAGADPTSFECPFGPIPVRPSRFGAESAVTVRFPTSLAFYSALTFLKTGSLALPLPAVPAGGASTTNVPVPFLLDDGTIDPEELPIDAPAQMLSTAAWPTLDGAPVVTIEASTPGLSAAVTIGQGVAFDDSPPVGNWIVRAAYPGSADGVQDFAGDRLGGLVIEGTIDPDLFYGVSVKDPAGNRADARPRFSGLTGLLAPPAIPELSANPITPNPGGQALDLSFPDVLPDALSAPGRGFYRVRLTDAAGRSWTLYVPDPPDGAGGTVLLRLPELGGVFPLAAGSVQIQISGWSHPGFDLSRFLWSDLAREHEVSFHAVAVTRPLP